MPPSHEGVRLRAAPAKLTVAGTPPTVAVTLAMFSSCEALAGITVTLPVVLGGLVWLVVAMWGVGAVLVAFYRVSAVEAAPSVAVPA